MAVTETTTKVQGKIVLNNGTDSSGNIKTVTISMPELSTTATATQIYDAVTNLSPLLTKTVYILRRVSTSEITNPA